MGFRVQGFWFGVVKVLDAESDLLWTLKPKPKSTSGHVEQQAKKLQLS